MCLSRGKRRGVEDCPGDTEDWGMGVTRVVDSEEGIRLLRTDPTYRTLGTFHQQLNGCSSVRAILGWARASLLASFTNTSLLPSFKQENVADRPLALML